MTADEALQQVRRLVNSTGQPVAIRRISGTGPSQTFVDTPTRGYVRQYASAELIGLVTQGDVKAVVLMDGLAAILPVRTTDSLLVGSKLYSIKNPAPRVVAGVQIALDIQARG